MERQACFALNVLDLSKAVNFPGGAAAADDLRARFIVLVLDFADNAFDQIFWAGLAGGDVSGGFDRV